MPIDLPDPELYALIRHELTHIFQYHILFSGSLGKSLTASPPQWFMEGMASYYGEDEPPTTACSWSTPSTTCCRRSSRRRRLRLSLRTRRVFDFIEDRWGKDGLRDFLYEFR